MVNGSLRVWEESSVLLVLIDWEASEWEEQRLLAGGRKPLC